MIILIHNQCRISNQPPRLPLHHLYAYMEYCIDDDFSLLDTWIQLRHHNFSTHTPRTEQYTKSIERMPSKHSIKIKYNP
jgi:hypothetical protein